MIIVSILMYWGWEIGKPTNFLSLIQHLFYYWFNLIIFDFALFFLFLFLASKSSINDLSNFSKILLSTKLIVNSILIFYINWFLNYIWLLGIRITLWIFTIFSLLKVLLLIFWLTLLLITPLFLRALLGLLEHFRQRSFHFE